VTVGPAFALNDQRTFHTFIRERDFPMFAFFSDRLGCLGSLLVSVIGTVILLVLLRLLT
jgi:hypothetical protein